MASVPERYDVATDSRVRVTQKWVHDMQQFVQTLGKAREAAKHAISFDPQMTLPETRALRDFLAAWKPEFEQKK